MKIVPNVTWVRDEPTRPPTKRIDASTRPVGAGVDIALSPQSKALLALAAQSRDAASAIMHGHNLRHIQYTELVAVADQLKQAGALQDEDYLDFIGPSPEHAQLDGSTAPNWNAKRDYIALREQQVAFLKATHAEQRFIDFAEYHLGLMLHFQAMHRE